MEIVQRYAEQLCSTACRGEAGPNRATGAGKGDDSNGTEGGGCNPAKSPGKNIYDGNAGDQEKTTKEYMAHYGKYIFKQRTAKINPLSGKDLQITADEMRESAAGLDNWAPADLKMLPPHRVRAIGGTSKPH